MNSGSLAIATILAGILAPMATGAVAPSEVAAILVAAVPASADCLRLSSFSGPSMPSAFWAGSHMIGAAAADGAGEVLAAAWTWSRHSDANDEFVQLSAGPTEIYSVESGWTGTTNGAGSPSPYGTHTYYWAANLPDAVFGIVLDLNGITGSDLKFYEYCDNSGGTFVRGPEVEGGISRRSPASADVADQRGFAGLANAMFGQRAAAAATLERSWNAPDPSVVLLASGGRAEGNAVGATALGLNPPASPPKTSVDCATTCLADPHHPAVVATGPAGPWKARIDASARAGEDDIILFAVSGDLALIG